MMPAQKLAFVILIGTIVVTPTLEAAAQELYPPEPNPFCPTTESVDFTFDLPATAHVVLEITGPFGVFRTLSAGYMAAGTHRITWDGRDDAGVLLQTAEYNAHLIVDGVLLPSQFVTAFCGDDLDGPYRRRFAGQDLEVAFCVGLEGVQQYTLEIRDAAGATAIRDLGAGVVSGVLPVTWDLRDAGGAQVEPGTYMCRLVADAYQEDVLFDLLPFRPVALTMTLTDLRGSVRLGSQDPNTATVVETPVQEGYLYFGRALTTGEYNALWEIFDAYGALEYFGGEFAVAPDTSFIHLNDFSQFVRPWDDIYGFGSVELDSLAATPFRACFHFKHTFAGITATDEIGDLIGNRDPDDWYCSGAVAGDTVFVPVNELLPAYPNPVSPGGTTAILFTIVEQSRCYLRVIDSEGYVTRTLVDRELPAGSHMVQWDLRDDEGQALPSDIYHVILEILDPVEGVQFLCSGDVAVTSEPMPVPGGIAGGGATLGQNHPNPFNPRTTIDFRLASPCTVDLRVFDLAGRLVAILIDRQAYDRGSHGVSWNGRDAAGRGMPAGSYFYRLIAGNTSRTKRMTLIK